jgi:hypothetical protein
VASCKWRVVSGELWLARVFVRGSVREVCAEGEDILLSEGDGKNKQV